MRLGIAGQVDTRIAPFGRGLQRLCVTLVAPLEEDGARIEVGGLRLPLNLSSDGLSY
jgi:hypothetical protein